MGLIFLTDLKGYDVVLGKLAATSLNGFYGLLAVFPLLAFPLLTGRHQHVGSDAKRSKQDSAGGCLWQRRQHHDLRSHGGRFGRHQWRRQPDQPEPRQTPFTHPSLKCSQLCHLHVLWTNQQQMLEQCLCVQLRGRSQMGYTGITRGKKLVVLIGQRKALGMAVRNNRTENRFSGLLARLMAPGS